MGAIAEGLVQRASAPAQGDGHPLNLEAPSVGIHHLHRPGDQVRTVSQRLDLDVGHCALPSKFCSTTQSITSNESRWKSQVAQQPSARVLPAIRRRGPKVLWPHRPTLAKEQCMKNCL